MIENINDIAGIRIVCPLQKDIYTIKNLLQNVPGIKTLKEKDYITKPNSEIARFCLSYNFRCSCNVIKSDNLC